MADTCSVSDHFVNKDHSIHALYDQLIKMLITFGPVEEDPKKTSIHLNRNSHWRSGNPQGPPVAQQQIGSQDYQSRY